MGICLDKDPPGQPSRKAREIPGGPLSNRTGHQTFIQKNHGRVQDVYRLDKKLGEGTYGTVYMGVHKQTEAVRAIKKIPKAGIDPKKFSQEIEIMMMMDHPHIIKLFETFEDSSTIHLAMELCSGGELFDYITSAHHFTEGDAALIMRQVLQSVFYMHQQEVCHRDLKPENFLFLSKSPIAENNLKIIDFGLSCRSAPGQIHTTRVGTALYIAPQVLLGRYDRACDIWSCGVIMYILLCGAPPFQGKSDQETFTQVKQGKLEFGRGEWSVVSQDAIQLIRKLLKRHAKSRLTAEQALDDVWIKERAPRATSVHLSRTFVDNLHAFNAQNKLKKAALHIIAGQLQDWQISKLRRAFGALDANGDGQLTAEEMRSGLAKAGLATGASAKSLEELVQSIDTDGSGVIDYSEFLAATLDRRRYLSESVCRTAFNIFDLNGDGKITEAELSQILGNKDVKGTLGNSRVADILRDIDTNGDGEIDFQEFMAMMASGNEQSGGDSSDSEGECC